MKRIFLLLSGMLLLVPNVQAANELLYVYDYSDTALKALVKGNYRQVHFDCTPMDTGCIPGPPTITYVPPSTPEYWYYFSDEAGEIIKYKAYNSGGQVASVRVSLNSVERELSNIMIEGRADVDEFLSQHQAQMESGHDGKATANDELQLLKQFTSTSPSQDCSNNGDESQDSVFDLLRRGPSDLHKHWINTGIKPIYDSTGARVESLSTSVGFPSGIQATFGIAFLRDKHSEYLMDDGSKAYWKFDDNGLPYLELGPSQTAPNPLNSGAPSSVSNFFKRTDDSDKQSTNYTFTAQPTDPKFPIAQCIMEEIMEAADYAGPPTQRLFEPGTGVGNIGQCSSYTVLPNEYFEFKYFSQQIRWEGGKRVFYGVWTPVKLPRYRWRAMCK